MKKMHLNRFCLDGGFSATTMAETDIATMSLSRDKIELVTMAQNDIATMAHFLTGTYNFR
jgi:hypothetical protein